MIILDLHSFFGYDFIRNGEQFPLQIQSERLPKMNNLIRFFALFVAIAGLACASLAPSNTQIRGTRKSVVAGDPGPLISLPVPMPCQSLGTCYAPAHESR